VVVVVAEAALPVPDLVTAAVVVAVVVALAAAAVVADVLLAHRLVAADALQARLRAVVVGLPCRAHRLRVVAHPSVSHPTLANRF
jgi:hypothetical protein